MTMQTRQYNMGTAYRFFYCRHSLTCFQCKAELGIDLSGTDKIMRMRIYPWLTRSIIS